MVPGYGLGACSVGYFLSLSGKGTESVCGFGLFEHRDIGTLGDRDTETLVVESLAN